MPAESSLTPAWRNEYPFESNFLSIGATGHRLNYVDHGPKSPTGGPVLFVHGNPTWSFYYRNLIKAVGEPITPPLSIEKQKGIVLSRDNISIMLGMQKDMQEK